MSFMESAINDYLDAVEKQVGTAAREDTHIEASGGSHVVLKRPQDDEAQLIHLGRLEDMTELLRRGEEAAH